MIATDSDAKTIELADAPTLVEIAEFEFQHQLEISAFDWTRVPEAESTRARTNISGR